MKRAPLVAWIIGGLALGYGVLAAIRKAWLCDDAFISFRYAENLTRGLGLVYNAGERVEGYSNFLWTLWIAIGMRLGASPENWSMVWGVVCYAATLLILLADHLAWEGGSRSPASEPTVASASSESRPGPPVALVPLAGVLAAVHPDWHRYATSGLETSLFTFLVTLGFLLAVRSPGGRRGLAASGFVFGLAALTRPDGLLFAALVVGYVAWAARPRLAGVAAFAGAFLVAWLPYAIWKVTYYGEFLPNTYYAKSAYLPWYDQGWHYVRLYFQRYWSIAASVPIAGLALVLHARDGRFQRPLALALGLGLAYTAYVMHVGGDFMYARLLVPATPFLIIALARGLERLCAHRRAIHAVVALVLIAGVFFTPLPLRDAEIVHGIVDEPSVYRPEVLDRTRHDGLVLRRYFDGLPVRIAIVGSQAALAYYARPAVVIEGGTGLTDRWIARRPLEKRGRVGHEKVAPVSYLLERRVHFTIRHFAGATLDLDSQLPMAAIAFDSVPGRIVHWDPALLAEVERRGANFTDVPSALDGYIVALDQLTDEQARETYARLKRFYFDHVHDPVRERAFRERAERDHRSP